MNNGKITVVISAFPACGKSWLFNHFKGKKILDSDSSKFHWIEDKNGEKTRNLDFPANYIEHIKSNVGTADIILVSAHLEVRQALKNAGISYVTVYPDNIPGAKEEWLGRCVCRGNDISFIKFLDSSWDKFQQDILHEPFGEKLYSLGRAEYLADIINRIEDDWLLRIDSDDKRNSELAEALRLSEEEISTLVETFKKSNSAGAEVETKAGSYMLCKSPYGSNYLFARINLGPVSKFYKRAGYSFIVYNNTYNEYQVWAEESEIQNFCRHYKKAFEETLKTVASRINIDFTEFTEKITIDDHMLAVILAAKK